MSNLAIQIEHLSKKYRLGEINNGALFKDIQTWIALKRNKEDPHSKIGEDRYSNSDDYFWALKDISLDIQQGDRLGIIGKNGAGKSTLLKLLSRITAPTEGVIKIKGKIASLLEVGTGFHAELTGRENIYLNGAILGMKKRRISEKLDEIIAFSGIEQHIDTPVKRYSSGMYVRLAFAVAAHLDSDILIADEVLAVGDAEFQKKALGKMQDLSTGQGRTVLFVSHNMGAVKNLCNCGIVLEKGKIKLYSDSIDEVINNYISFNIENIACSTEKVFTSDKTKPFQITKIEITNRQGKQLNVYESFEDIVIRFVCYSKQQIPEMYGCFFLNTEENKQMIVCDSMETGKNIFNNMPTGEYTVELVIPKGLLAPGIYIPNLGFASSHHKGFSIEQYLNIFKFKVQDSLSERGNNRGALTATVLDWNITKSQ